VVVVFLLAFRQGQSRRVFLCLRLISHCRLCRVGQKRQAA
jgi:hypothetical protein